VCWRPVQENPWILIPMMAAAQHVELPAPAAPGEPGPFAFGDPERIRTILSEAGFEQISIRAYDESDAYGETVEETLDFLQHIGPLSRLLADVDEAKREAVLAAVREALKPYAGPDGAPTPRAMWMVTAETPA
jgi:hypothetical protein